MKDIRTVFGAGALSLFVVLFTAPDARAYETTGQMLHDIIGGEESFLRYRSFVAGVMQGHIVSATLYGRDQLACPSPDTTLQELAEDILEYLTVLASDPEMLTLPARTAAFTSLMKAYPCR